jgi:hypothetical protein
MKRPITPEEARDNASQEARTAASDEARNIASPMKAMRTSPG